MPHRRGNDERARASVSAKTKAGRVAFSDLSRSQHRTTPDYTGTTPDYTGAVPSLIERQAAPANLTYDLGARVRATAVYSRDRRQGRTPRRCLQARRGLLLESPNWRGVGRTPTLGSTSVTSL